MVPPSVLDLALRHHRHTGWQPNICRLCPDALGARLGPPATPPASSPATTIAACQEDQQNYLGQHGSLEPRCKPFAHRCVLVLIDGYLGCASLRSCRSSRSGGARAKGQSQDPHCLKQSCLHTTLPMLEAKVLEAPLLDRGSFCKLSLLGFLAVSRRLLLVAASRHAVRRQRALQELLTSPHSRSNKLRGSEHTSA